METPNQTSGQRSYSLTGIKIPLGHVICTEIAKTIIIHDPLREALSLFSE